MDTTFDSDLQQRETDTSAGNRNWLPALTVAIVAFMVLGGLAIWFLLWPSTPGDTSAEAGFARDMGIHHAQAVEMSLIVQERTENPDVRLMATDIILTQQGQIGQMRGWLDAWEVPPNSSEPRMAWMGHEIDGRMPGMASPEDVARLRELPAAEMDVLYLQLMIPHHVAGVDMAQAVLDRSDNPAIEFLANAIVTSQQKEIDIMNDMLADMDAEPVTEGDDEDSSH